MDEVVQQGGADLVRAATRGQQGIEAEQEVDRAVERVDIRIGEVRQGADGWPQVAPMFSPRIDGPDASGNLSVQLVPAAAGY